MNQIFYTISRYVYLIILISSVIIYSFNSSDYKEDAQFCAGQYEAGLYSLTSPELYFWKQDGLCCYHALNEENNIEEQCQ